MACIAAAHSTAPTMPARPPAHPPNAPPPLTTGGGPRDPGGRGPGAVRHLWPPAHQLELDGRAGKVQARHHKAPQVGGGWVGGRDKWAAWAGWAPALPRCLSSRAPARRRAPEGRSRAPTHPAPSPACSSAPHEVLLVLDGTTGLNMLNQVCGVCVGLCVEAVGGREGAGAAGSERFGATLPCRRA